MHENYNQIQMWGQMYVYLNTKNTLIAQKHFITVNVVTHEIHAE